MGLMDGVLGPCNKHDRLCNTQQFENKQRPQTPATPTPDLAIPNNIKKLEALNPATLNNLQKSKPNQEPKSKPI